VVRDVPGRDKSVFAHPPGLRKKGAGKARALPGGAERQTGLATERQQVETARPRESDLERERDALPRRRFFGRAIEPERRLEPRGPKARIDQAGRERHLLALPVEIHPAADAARSEEHTSELQSRQ